MHPYQTQNGITFTTSFSVQYCRKFSHNTIQHMYNNNETASADFWIIRIYHMYNVIIRKIPHELAKQVQCTNNSVNVISEVDHE